MLAPKPFFSLIGKYVVHWETRRIFERAASAAWVVSAGCVVSSTGASAVRILGACCRAANTSWILLVVAATSSRYPARLGVTPVIDPPEVVYEAFTGARSTSTATRSRTAGSSVVSIVEVRPPSGVRVKVVQVRKRDARRIGDSSAPETRRVMGWTMRSAASIATIASVVVTSGSITVIGTSISMRAGASRALAAATAAASGSAASATRPFQPYTRWNPPASVTMTLASVGSTRSGARASATPSARASASQVIAGVRVMPRRAVRTSAMARSIGLPSRPTAMAWATSASTSTRRPNASNGMLMGPRGPWRTISPWVSEAYASRRLAAAAAGSMPDRSTSPTATPGRTRPTYCWS